MTSSGSGTDHAKSNASSSSDVVATLGAPPELSGRHPEQPQRTHYTPNSRVFPPPHLHQNTSLPFPLNLPPSYPVYPFSSPLPTSARPPRQPPLRQTASLPTNQLLTKASNPTEGHTRVRSAASASPSKGKGKVTLDTFMDSRNASTAMEPESSGSETDVVVGRRLTVRPSDDYPLSDSSALPSSSPPSSSPLRTPKESYPLHPMYPYASSPTPKRTSQPTTVPFVLPPGPYSFEKPHWSLSALIGQALNASRSGSLALSDIYDYISTVYPHYDRGDQLWMSSIRHNLSLQDAFERMPEEEGSKTKKSKTKPKTKGGSWQIKPGYEACFVGGNFVKKGARGAGPGQNHSRKRPSEDDGERKDKRMKAEKSASRPRSAASVASTSTSSRARPRLSSPPRDIYSHFPSRRVSSPPSLTTSLITIPSDASLPDPVDLPPSSPIPFGHDSDAMADPHGSPELPLALVTAKRNAAKGRTLSLDSLLEPGFELSRISGLQSSARLPVPQSPEDDVNRDLFSRVLASSSSAHASSLSGPSSSPSPARLLFPPPFPSSSTLSSSPLRPSTPPPRKGGEHVVFSPTRTPVSHRGVHMSPSRSLAHYQSSLEPEWKTTAGVSGVGGRVTPPPLELGSETTTTPRKLVFPPGPSQASPFRTPSRPMSQRHQRGYDPYDPNMLLADELASIRNANNPQESPGGFFGKEGRRLLYESPSVPSRSHWRLCDEF